MDLVKSTVIAYPGESVQQALKMRENNLDLVPMADRATPDRIIGC